MSLSFSMVYFTISFYGLTYKKPRIVEFMLKAHPLPFLISFLSTVIVFISIMSGIL